MNVLKTLNGMKKNKEIDVNNISMIGTGLNGTNCMTVVFDEFALTYDGESTMVVGQATVDQIVESNKSMKKYIKTMNDVLNGKDVTTTTTTTTTPATPAKEIPTAPAPTATPDVTPTVAPTTAPVAGKRTKIADWFTETQWGKVSKENKEVLKAHFKAGTMTKEMQDQILNFIGVETAPATAPTAAPATPVTPAPTVEQTIDFDNLGGVGSSIPTLPGLNV